MSPLRRAALRRWICWLLFIGGWLQLVFGDLAYAVLMLTACALLFVFLT